MAVDYRQLQAPSVLDTALPDNGGARVAGELANAFKSFSNDAADFGAAVRTKQGADEGAAAGASGNPDFKSGLKEMTIYGKAYNNAALRSYSIQAEATAEDTAAKLQVEANNDPDMFRTTFGAARDAVMKAAPIEAQPVLANLYNQRLASGMSQLSQAQAQQIQKSHRIDLSEGVARQTDRVAQLHAAGDPVSMAKAEEETVKLQMLIDGARNDNTISPVESAAMHIESQRAIVMQTTEAQFQRVLDDPHGDPVAYINAFDQHNRDNPTLPPDEAAKVKQNLFATLRQHNELESMGRRNGKTEEQMRHEAGDRTYTSLLFTGQLTTQKLTAAIASDDITPEIARTLANELSSGSANKSNPKTLFDVKTGLLDYTPEQIKEMPGLTWADKATLTDEWHTRNSGWEGTQSAHEAKARIDRALGIVPGTMVQMLSNQEKTERQTALTKWYDEMSGVDANKRETSAIPVAQKIIGTVMRQTQTAKASTFRAKLQAFQAAHPDTSKMDKEEKKAYDQQTASYERRIQEAEAEAARQ